MPDALLLYTKLGVNNQTRASASRDLSRAYRSADCGPAGRGVAGRIPVPAYDGRAIRAGTCRRADVAALLAAAIDLLWRSPATPPPPPAGLDRQSSI
jgi:hypothetical protein